MITWALLCGAGFAAGFVDSIAGGGGLVTVPALLAAGLPVDVALGTNKGQAVFGATTSTIGYGRAGLLRPRVLRFGFPAGFVGALLGAFAVTRLDPNALKPLVLLLLLGAAALVLVPRPRPREDVSAGERERNFREDENSEGVHEPKASEPRAWLMAVALLLGAYDGFFGPGTGTLLIVAFLWIFRESALSASANAKVVNLASNLAAFCIFLLKGKIVWAIAVPMGLCNVFGAWLGTRVTLKRGSGFVRVIAVAIALALAAKVALQW